MVEYFVVQLLPCISNKHSVLLPHPILGLCLGAVHTVPSMCMARGQGWLLAFRLLLLLLLPGWICLPGQPALSFVHCTT